MFRSVKEAGICLIVNSVLKSVKGVLDFSFGSDLYTKYGIRNGITVQPIGNFDPTSLEFIPTQLSETANCSGWPSITTFKFNNQSLSPGHIPLILSILISVPKFRPSTIELKGTDADVMSELVPAIYELYKATGSKPKIVFMNSFMNTRPKGAIARNNSNNSNNNTRRRRLPGVGAPNTRTANALRSAANVLKKAANTGNTSGVSAAIASALGPNQNLNLSAPLRNPFKGNSEAAANAGASADPAPAKKGWFSWGGGRRKTQRRKRTQKRR